MRNSLPWLISTVSRNSEKSPLLWARQCSSATSDTTSSRASTHTITIASGPAKRMQFSPKWCKRKERRSGRKLLRHFQVASLNNAASAGCTESTQRLSRTSGRLRKKSSSWSCIKNSAPSGQRSRHTSQAAPTLISRTDTTRAWKSASRVASLIKSWVESLPSLSRKRRVSLNLNQAPNSSPSTTTRRRNRRQKSRRLTRHRMSQRKNISLSPTSSPPTNHLTSSNAVKWN